MQTETAPRPGARTRIAAGFTLIELAIVLFIITLLLGGMLTPLGQQVAEHQNKESRLALESARIAIVGYALRQIGQAGPLPCPDLRADHATQANDGLEDRLANGKCALHNGNLPWKTLGLTKGDAWGNQLSYAVAADWTEVGAPLSGALAELQVCQNRACTSPTPAAAIILSHGRNGFGAKNINGGDNLMPTSSDELENINPDARFIMHPPRAADRAEGEFDDLLLPLSSDWLRGRLCDPAFLCSGS